MTAPVIRQFVGTIPAKGQAQTAFDANVDAWLGWTTTQFAPDIVSFGAWADGIRAALIAGNLPSLAGRALDAVRVNAEANGVEFANVTAAGWAVLDDVNAAAQRVTLGLVIGTNVSALVPSQTQAVFNTGTSTTESTITAAKLEAKIRSQSNVTGTAPMFACRAWVNFNGTGTVAIRASGNVSSITDNGVGDYTVNFATAMQDAGYAVAVNVLETSYPNGTPWYANASIYFSNYVDIALGIRDAGTTSAHDRADIFVAIFR